MCGLFGGASSILIASEIGTVLDLGLLSQFRGVNATGMAVLSKNDGKLQYSVRKRPEPAGFFLNTQDTHTWLEKQKDIVCISGHSRAATTGALSKTNAHPFHFKDIIGVHNGQMGAFDDKTPEEDGYEKKSDSYKFYEMLAEEGPKAALEKAHLNSGLCAYALIWFDLKELTMKCIRNKDRPLWFMPNSTETTHYWSSEWSMLNFIDKRTNTAYKPPFQIAEDTLYTWNIQSNKWKSEKYNIQRTRAIKGWTDNRSSRSADSKWWDQQDELWAGYEMGEFPESDPSTIVGPRRVMSNKEKKKLEARRQKALVAELDKREKASNVILLNPPAKQDFVSDILNVDFLTAKDDDYWYVGYNGQQYDITSARKLVERANSCSFCPTVANVNTKVWWRNPRDYICDKCYRSGLLSELDDRHKYHIAKLTLRKTALAF